EPVDEPRLRGRVIGVPGLAEETGGRADQDEAALAEPLHFAQERTGRQVGNRQVPADRLFPALERQLPDRKVLLRPLAGDCRADVEPAKMLDGTSKEVVRLCLTSQVGAEDRCAPELLAQSLGSVAALVVVQ